MRITKRSAIAFLVATLGTNVALADNPHFLKAASSINSITGALTCSFKEVGLGDNISIDFKCEAQQASATYVCVNRGGKNPAAQNKQSVNGPVSSTGTFESGKNGSITGSLSVQPPSSGSFSCPGGQRMELAQVSYSGVFLSDLTNGILEMLEPQSTGCLLPQVQGACN